MPLIELPPWRDKENPPQTEEKAQPVWIFGQWQFIPFAFGNIPLRKCFGTSKEAQDEANRYENDFKKLEDDIASAAASKKRLAKDYLKEFVDIYSLVKLNVPDCPPEFKVFAVENTTDCICIIIENDFLINDSLANYGEALSYISAETNPASSLGDGP